MNQPQPLTPQFNSPLPLQQQQPYKDQDNQDDERCFMYSVFGVLVVFVLVIISSSTYSFYHHPR
jgi:hypothetical protein